MSKTIRISPNEDMLQALDFLKAKRFPFLKDDEIVKLALSRLYREEREEQPLYMQQGGISFQDDDEMGEWWAKNKEYIRSDEP